MAIVSMVYWLPIGGLAAQVGWFGPKVGGHLAPCYIHHVNRVNSGNGSAMMTAL